MTRRPARVSLTEKQASLVLSNIDHQYIIHILPEHLAGPLLRLWMRKPLAQCIKIRPGRGRHGR